MFPNYNDKDFYYFLVKRILIDNRKQLIKMVNEFYFINKKLI